MNQHFLQSPTWEKYEQLEGHQTFRVTGEGFSALAILHSTPLGNYLFCPYGPSIDLNHPNLSPTELLKSALNALTQVAHANHAFFIRIEPTFPLSDPKSLNLHKSHDIDPAHTWVIDLNRPETEILSDITEDRKVRRWRNHEKKGLKLRQTTDPKEITILMNFLEQTGARNHFSPQNRAHLENQLKSRFATLYVAELSGEPIAASLVHDHNGVRYAVHASADDAHRNLAAGTIISIQEMIDASRNGFHEFDFWGVTTSTDPKHPWYGFTKHKKSFGGHQVNYAGTWDFPVNIFKYHLYQFIRLINRFKRKLFH